MALHQLIDEVADDTARNVVANDIRKLTAYPPNGGFSKSELQAVKEISELPDAESTVRKLIAGANGRVIFSLLNFLDGTGDPDPDIGQWWGLRLADADRVESDKGAMLHDDFYEAYWRWLKIRPSKGWRLDIRENP